MQRELNLMGLISTDTVDLPAKSIACCDTEQAAIRMCIRHHKAGWHQDKIAEAIPGLTPDALTKMVRTDSYLKQGKNKACRWMSRTMQMALQQECGNNAIDQWADMCKRGLLNCQRTVDQRLQELEAERAILLAQAGSR